MAADSPLRRPAARLPRRSPLGRRPKSLDAPPTLFELGQGGALVTAGSVSARHAGAPAPRGVATATTDEAAALVAPDTPRRAAPDPYVLARARQIAARLAVPRPRRDAAVRRGAGALASLPYRGGSDDVDLDRTLEVLAERPVPEDEDIVVRERVRARRSVALLIDISGSMRGERVRNAAATLGALAAELSHDALGVVAFWSDAAVLARLGQAVPPLTLVEALLGLPTRGLTNIAFPLEVAARELAAAPARDARAVLLSDCVHNAGPDPRPPAARLPRLDVLLDVTGEHDLALARELARCGRGRLARITHHRDIAPAVSRVFAT